MQLGTIRMRDGRIIRKERLDEIYADDLEGSFEKAVETLQKAEQRCQESEHNYYSLSLVFVREDEEYDGSSNKYIIVGERKPTDEELQNFAKAEKKSAELSLDYERRQYEALKAKFETK